MTVRVERRNSHLIMTLDRPQALNALNLEMIDILSKSIRNIESDATLQGGILTTSNPRAYCAGGDIKQAREYAMNGRIDDAMRFFRAEYGLNKQMFHCSKPLVAMIDGVTMGGGVGISASCRYRVATPKTLWAMPEVGIGFFPDVGAAYYLARMPNDYGLYLGMTGARVDDPALLLGAGIATNIIDSSHVNEFIDIVVNHGMDQAISEFDLSILSKFPIKQDILYDPSYAPLSVCVAEQHIKKAQGEDFDTVIARDLKLAAKFMIEPDFVEGVRAVVVDKDRSPAWSCTREDLKDFNIDRYLN